MCAKLLQFVFNIIPQFKITFKILSLENLLQLKFMQINRKKSETQ